MRPSVGGPSRPVRLHHGGAFRRRLATLLGRSEAEGDVIWRRLVHGTGAFVLVYFLVPSGFFVVVSKEVVLLLALAAVGLLELLRLGVRVELPTIRTYETRRPASYLFYAVGLVVAVLCFPEPIAAAVVLGTAFVDPIAGALRSHPRPTVRLGVPWAAYAVLATGALAFVGRWTWPWALGLGVAAGAVGVAVERWRFRWLDDDLTMTVVPALLLYGAALAVGLPR